MTKFYLFPRWALRTGLLLAPAGAALAQVPAITSVIPMANAQAAARNSAVTVSFSQPLTAASAGALKVFSSQRGGLRTRGTTPAVVSGSTLSFTPTAYPFMPGETVQYTVTTAAASSGGALTRSRMGQFTAAVGGTGVGTVSGGQNVSVQINPVAVAVADVNADGWLDLLVTNSGSNTVSVRINDGRGTFGNGWVVAVDTNPSSLLVADFDGDGDLDFLTSSASMGNNPSTINIRLNNGSGLFSGNVDLDLGYGRSSLAVGDMDGDGDVDIVAANQVTNRATLLLNNGNATFTAGQDVILPSDAGPVIVHDLDGDGSLDIIVLHTTGSAVNIHLNNGNATFGIPRSISAGPTMPLSMAAGDVDNDGDLDLVMSNVGSPATPGSTVSVRLNNGSGVFSGTQDVPVGTLPKSVNLGDIDGDGDLDILTTNESNNGTGTVSERLNNGNGIFSGGRDIGIGYASVCLALGDVDNDSDLDIITAVYYSGYTTSNTAGVRLNGGTGPLTTAASHPAAPALTLFPNPATSTTTLTGAIPSAPFTVFDALGRVLFTATADATGAARLVLPEGLPAGVYLVRSGGQVRRLAVE